MHIYSMSEFGCSGIQGLFHVQRKCSSKNNAFSSDAHSLIGSSQVFTVTQHAEFLVMYPLRAAFKFADAVHYALSVQIRWCRVLQCQHAWSVCSTLVQVIVEHK